MGSKRHKPEDIVTKLRQVEVLVGQGMARVDAIREVRITEQTHYRWRKQKATAEKCSRQGRICARGARASPDSLTNDFRMLLLGLIRWPSAGRVLIVSPIMFAVAVRKRLGSNPKVRGYRLPTAIDCSG